jgi:hypothetical protein
MSSTGDKDKQQKARDDAGGGNLLRIAPAEEPDVVPTKTVKDTTQTGEDTANAASGGDEERTAAGQVLLVPQEEPAPAQEPPIPVASKVKEEPIYRAVEENHVQKRRSIMMILAVLGVAAVIAVILGVYSADAESSADHKVLVSPDDKVNKEKESSPDEKAENVLIAHYYKTSQSSSGWPQVIEIKKFRQGVTGEEFVEGRLDDLACRPIACMSDSDPKPCAVYHGEAEKNYFFDYEKMLSGECCLLPDCTQEQIDNGDQCGEQCFQPSKSCIIPSGCLSPDCMECALDEYGEDIYSITHRARDYFCMTTGTRTDEEYGTWDWAVICGKNAVAFEGGVEENRAVGEIDCHAVRYGENLSFQVGGLATHLVPCQFLSLLTCQCAPDDVFTFGLDEPLCPCQKGKLLQLLITNDYLHC